MPRQITTSEPWQHPAQLSEARYGTRRASGPARAPPRPRLLLPAAACWCRGGAAPAVWSAAGPAAALLCSRPKQPQPRRLLPAAPRPPGGLRSRKKKSWYRASCAAEAEAEERARPAPRAPCSRPARRRRAWAPRRRPRPARPRRAAGPRSCCTPPPPWPTPQAPCPRRSRCRRRCLSGGGGSRRG